GGGEHERQRNECHAHMGGYATARRCTRETCAEEWWQPSLRMLAPPGNHQLLPEPVHRVHPQASFNLVRSSASPRLTRLRTTDSEHCRRRASSSYSVSWSTRPSIAPRCAADSCSSWSSAALPSAAAARCSTRS